MNIFLAAVVISCLGNLTLWFLGWQLTDWIQIVLCPPFILVFIPLIAGNGFALRWTLKERKLLIGHIIGAILASWGILFIVWLFATFAPASPIG